MGRCHSLDNADVMMRDKHLAMCAMVYAIEKKHLAYSSKALIPRDIAEMTIPH